MPWVSASVDGTIFSPAFSRSVATNSGGTAAARCACRLQYSWARRLDLLLPLADQADGHRLDAPRRQAAADLLPEKRADLVADQAVEHAPRLLGVDALLVDAPGRLECGLDRLLGDLVEEHPVDAVRRDLELLGDVPADRLAFTVGVGGDVERLRRLAGLLQVLQRLRLRADGDVLRTKLPLLEVDAELALREILQVTERGLHHVSPVEVLLDGLHLRG